MKHAGPAALAAIASLLQRLRALPALVERKPGIFYVRSKAYLHFHEDPAGIFADVKLDGGEFDRLPVTTTKEQARLLELVAKSLRDQG
jgi:hypothetical protein